MPTADVQAGNACGYIEEINVPGTVTVNYPRKSNEKQTAGASPAVVGLVVTRKYCVLPSGHGGGHSYRTT